MSESQWSACVVIRYLAVSFAIISRSWYCASKCGNLCTNNSHVHFRSMMYSVSRYDYSFTWYSVMSYFISLVPHKPVYVTSNHNMLSSLSFPKNKDETHVIFLFFCNHVWCVRASVVIYLYRVKWLLDISSLYTVILTRIKKTFGTRLLCEVGRPAKLV